MAVKWIGAAARELGISPLDAVELLASRHNYPMNGLLDEDRFQMLRIFPTGKRSVDGSGSSPVPSGVRERDKERNKEKDAAPLGPPPKVETTPIPPPAPKSVHGESTSVTAPFPTQPEGKSEERTVILPPPSGTTG